MIPAAHLSALAEAERAKYDRVWRMDAYRVACHGLMLWEHRRELFPPQFRTAVDLGCGTGRLVARWLDEGYEAFGVDLSRESVDADILVKYGNRFAFVPIWSLQPAVEPSSRIDVGVCTDVMEHIPEPAVDVTLGAIAGACKWVLFKIAHGPANDLGGEPLHMTQRPLAWWISRMTSVMGGEIEYLGVQIRNGNHDSLIRWEHRE